MPASKSAVALFVCAVLTACAEELPVGAGTAERTVPAVAPYAQTETGVTKEANSAAIWIHPSEPARSLVIGSGGSDGIGLYGLDGSLKGRYTDASVDLLDVEYGFTLSGAPTALVIAYERSSGALVAYTVDPDSLKLMPVSARALVTDAEVTGLCAYRSPLTGRHYVFAPNDDGEVQQWELFERGGKVDGRLVRTIPFGVGSAYCTVDDDNGVVYVTEETVGIWKLPAEPETDAERTAVDLAEPFGRIAGDVKGAGIYKLDAKEGYLLAVDADAGRINAYSLVDSRFAGSFTVGGDEGDGAMGEPEGLAVSSFDFGADTAGGLVVVADQGGDGQESHYKLLSWTSIASALQLPVAKESDPRTTRQPAVKTVKPTVETEPVDDYGDAADDPAIWIHPRDPAKSLIIGAQKKRGLYVYDLSGKTLQVLPDGRMNNVDLRQGVNLGSGIPDSIVAASNRTDNTLALYAVDGDNRRLINIAAGKIPTGFRDPYGLCMYHSRKSGSLYVFVNDSDNGTYRQWRLVPQGSKVTAELVREFVVGSQAEGCAADDETGALYIAEEDVGLWRYSAEPDGGTERTQIDSTGKGSLTADVEGVAIYAGPNGTGYLIVSNQGADNFAVYRREGRNELIGHFAIVANDELGIDGVSETDGLDVTSTSLGDAFPGGVLVVQDGRNIMPRAKQNFKLVPWRHIEQALSLGAAQ